MFGTAFYPFLAHSVLLQKLLGVPEVSQSAIKAKLEELGAYVDDELPDYIMVMVANKKSQECMTEDLRLFLNKNAALFTKWLHDILERLQALSRGEKPTSNVPKSIKSGEHIDGEKKRHKKKTKEREKDETDKVREKKHKDKEKDKDKDKSSKKRHKSREPKSEKIPDRPKSDESPKNESKPKDAKIEKENRSKKESKQKSSPKKGAEKVVTEKIVTETTHDGLSGVPQAKGVPQKAAPPIEPSIRVCEVDSESAANENFQPKEPVKLERKLIEAPKGNDQPKTARVKPFQRTIVNESAIPPAVAITATGDAPTETESAQPTLERIQAVNADEPTQIVTETETEHLVEKRPSRRRVVERSRSESRGAESGSDRGLDSNESERDTSPKPVRHGKPKSKVVSARGKQGRKTESRHGGQLFLRAMNAAVDQGAGRRPSGAGKKPTAAKSDDEQSDSSDDSELPRRRRRSSRKSTKSGRKSKSKRRKRDKRRSVQAEKSDGEKSDGNRENGDIDKEIHDAKMDLVRLRRVQLKDTSNDTSVEVIPPPAPAPPKTAPSITVTLSGLDEAFMRRVDKNSMNGTPQDTCPIPRRTIVSPTEVDNSAAATSKEKLASFQTGGIKKITLRRPQEGGKLKTTPGETQIAAVSSDATPPKQDSPTTSHEMVSITKLTCPSKMVPKKVGLDAGEPPPPGTSVGSEIPDNINQKQVSPLGNQRNVLVSEGGGAMDSGTGGLMAFASTEPMQSLPMCPGGGLEDLMPAPNRPPIQYQLQIDPVSIQLDEEEDDDDAIANDVENEGIHVDGAFNPEIQVTEETSPLGSPISSGTMPSPLPAASGSRPLCRFWPNCAKGPSCPFAHPAAPGGVTFGGGGGQGGLQQHRSWCRSFPSCPFGADCAYQHPPCRFASSCSRPACPFQHPAGGAPVHQQVGGGVQAQGARSQQGEMARQAARDSLTGGADVPVAPAKAFPGLPVNCKFANKCMNPACPFQHPKPCNFGAACSRPNCPFMHRAKTQRGKMTPAGVLAASAKPVAKPKPLVDTGRFKWVAVAVNNSERAEGTALGKRTSDASNGGTSVDAGSCEVKKLAVEGDSGTPVGR